MITTMVFATAMRFAATEVSTSMKFRALVAPSIPAATEGLIAAESTVTVEISMIPESFNPDGFAAMEIPATTEIVPVVESFTTEAVAVAKSLTPEVIAIMEATEQAVALVDLGMPVVEVVPGADADEHAICKIIRTPIAVGCATKRIIRIISVGADRRRIVVAVIRTDLHADGNLRLRIDCRYR